MHKMTHKFICFGETLWDIFPDKKVIGGAPLNVALRLNSLGHEVRMISKIGQDQDGINLLEYLKKQKLIIDGIQIDQQLPTGNVQVHLDQNNTATYSISAPVAWDHIEVNQTDIEHIKYSDAFIYGSLSCRNKVTRETLHKYIKHASFKIFDANLRAPFYDFYSIKSLMQEADLIKLNDEELIEISDFLELSDQSMEQQISALSRLFGNRYICVTLGSKGAILFSDGKFYSNPGYPIKVKDTVGAGDSFLASLTHQLLKGKAPQYALDFACAMGAIVASNHGANPKVSKLDLSRFVHID